MFHLDLADKCKLTMPVDVSMHWEVVVCLTAQGRGSVHELGWELWPCQEPMPPH